ncbi:MULTISPECIES: hypothetical protein [Sphingomonas]|uniref:hypothetical protein n=1 Tax=Sphingomonas TaxID=13687 RepID=UPI00126A1FF4|nr:MULTISPECIES: hypothetical protein [Sphingomonas]
MNQLDFRPVGHIFVFKSTGTDGAYGYEYYSIEYPEGSCTFRRNLTQGTPFEAEYPNCGTMTLTANGVLFQDKNGVTLETNVTGSGVIVLTYPDGRQIQYKFLDGQFNRAVTIANNFGFILKNETNSQGVLVRAINRAIDACAVEATSCGAVSFDRHSSLQTGDVPGLYFYDSAGGRTIYRSTVINAYTEKKYYINNYNASPTPGNDPFIVPRYYPAGITFPWNTAESLTISYSNPDTQDEVLVSSIVKDGTTVTYNQQRQLYGSYGSSNNINTLPYLLKISSSSSGNQLSYSEANRGFRGWGGGRLVLDFVTDALGKTTTYGFNMLHEVSSVGLPEGNGQRFEYDSRWNVKVAYQTPKPGSGASEIATQYVYPESCTAQTQAFCNKPSAVIDARNGETDYTYNSAGQITSVTLPADRSGLRKTTLFSYTLRTAYIKDNQGNVVPAGPPISMLTSETSCQTTQTCSGTADEVTKTYDYGPFSGPNNLLLKGIAVTSNGITLRTCYGYNYFGEKISESSPRAGLSSCS